MAILDNTKSVEDIFMRRFPLLCLGILLVLAGCVSGPVSSQEGSVAVTVNNSPNLTSTHTFDIWVVNHSANVLTRRDDGLAGNYTIGPGLSTHSPGDNHTWRTVELPETARLHGQYTLEPGEENQSSIEEFPRNFAVVVVIYQNENEIVSWVSATCDGNLVFLEVTMFHYGSGSAYNCEGGLI